MVCDHLQASGDSVTKQWMENYVKGVPSRGNKAPACRRALYRALGAFAPAPVDKTLDTLAVARAGAASFSVASLADAACSLVKSSYGDDKFTGILLLADFVLADKRPTAAQVLETGAFLARVAALFDSGAISEWPSSDGMSMKVLGPFVLQKPAGAARRDAARAVLSWSALTTGSVWRRRAGHVSFVNYIVRRGSKAGGAPKGDALLYPGFVSELIGACKHVCTSVCVCVYIGACARAGMCVNVWMRVCVYAHTVSARCTCACVLEYRNNAGVD